MSSVDRSPLLSKSREGGGADGGNNGSPAPSQSSRQRLAALPRPHLANTADGELKSPLLLSSSSFPPSSLSVSSKAPTSLSSISSVVLSRYHSRHSTLLLSLILLVLLIVYVMTERSLLTGSNSPLLSSSSLEALNNATVAQSYFGPTSLSSNSTHRTRVIYCIVDGLRYDALTTNPTLSSFVSSLSPDALVFPLQAQLPTISIPNWITLLTGVTPSMHGRTGNDDTSLLPFSSIFSSTLAQSRPNGLTASEWWSALTYPSLTPSEATAASVRRSTGMRRSTAGVRAALCGINSPPTASSRPSSQSTRGRGR